MTLAESMASGVPVVSTRVGQSVDVIQHGLNGLLADVGDAEGLAQNLAALFRDRSLRQRLVVEARRAVQALDVRVIAKRYRDEAYRVGFAS